MEIRRSEWEEEKYFTADQVRATALKIITTSLPQGSGPPRIPRILRS